MARRFRRRSNSRGEWSILDRVLGHRVCRFNDSHHGGPHVHYPETGPDVGAVEIDNESDALAIMEAYARRYDTFNRDRFQELVKSWRFASGGR